MKTGKNTFFRNKVSKVILKSNSEPGFGFYVKFRSSTFFLRTYTQPDTSVGGHKYPKFRRLRGGAWRKVRSKTFLFDALTFAKCYNWVIKKLEHVFMFTTPFGTLIGTFSEKIFFGTRLPTLVGIDLVRPPQNIWPLNFEKSQYLRFCLPKSDYRKIDHFLGGVTDFFLSTIVISIVFYPTEHNPTENTPSGHSIDK